MVQGRTSNRRPVVLGVLVTVGALIAPLGAWAAPSFNDVPESHPFYEEIEWMASTGITEGFPDGGFHPSDPVTRQAMSAFMQRLYDLQEETVIASADTSSSTSSTTFTPLPGSTITLEVPPGAEARVIARFSGESRCYSSGGIGAYCRLRIMRQVGPSFTDELDPAVGTEFVFDSNEGGSTLTNSYESNSITRHDTVGRGGTYTYRVEYLSSSASNSFTLDDWTFEVESDLLLSSDTFGP